LKFARGRAFSYERDNNNQQQCQARGARHLQALFGLLNFSTVQLRKFPYFYTCRTSCVVGIDSCRHGHADDALVRACMIYRSGQSYVIVLKRSRLVVFKRLIVCKHANFPPTLNFHQAAWLRTVRCSCKVCRPSSRYAEKDLPRSTLKHSQL
jgi:hypothetical protein